MQTILFSPKRALSRGGLFNFSIMSEQVEFWVYTIAAIVIVLHIISIGVVWLVNKRIREIDIIDASDEELEKIIKDINNE